MTQYQASQQLVYQLLRYVCKCLHELLGSIILSAYSKYIASFPGLCAAFSCTKECGGPGTFPHMGDIKGRKTVERPKLNVGVLRLRTARRVKVSGIIPHVPIL